MKIHFSILFALVIPLLASGQEIDLGKVADSITMEAKKLYRSEMASWYGTDILVDKFQEKRNNSGGYFSYPDKNMMRCIFFSNNDKPVVIASFTIDSTYNVHTAIIDSAERDFTPEENDIYTFRKIALTEIQNDTLFKEYKNSNLNLIPLVDVADKKVYVLTGPEINGVIIFGNDYLLTFNKTNKLLSKKQLHRNIIVTNYGNQDNETVFGAMHNHLQETGDFITATDICTLMLYEKFAKWQQYLVLSDNYVSIWDCNKNSLLILTKEAWNKIYQKSKDN